MGLKISPQNRSQTWLFIHLYKSRSISIYVWTFPTIKCHSKTFQVFHAALIKSWLRWEICQGTLVFWIGESSGWFFWDALFFSNKNHRTSQMRWKKSWNRCRFAGLWWFGCFSRNLPPEWRGWFFFSEKLKVDGKGQHILTWWSLLAGVISKGAYNCFTYRIGWFQPWWLL